VIFSITNRLYRGGEVKREKTSLFFEVALVLVRFDQVAQLHRKRGSGHHDGLILGENLDSSPTEKE